MHLLVLHNTIRCICYTDNLQAAAAMALHTLGRLPTFRKGNKVLLKSTNLHFPYPYRKLAPKWEGPFPISEVMGPVAYKLSLPKK